MALLPSPVLLLAWGLVAVALPGVQTLRVLQAAGGWRSQDAYIWAIYWSFSLGSAMAVGLLDCHSLTLAAIVRLLVSGVARMGALIASLLCTEEAHLIIVFWLVHPKTRGLHRLCFGFDKELAQPFFGWPSKCVSTPIEHAVAGQRQEEIDHKVPPQEFTLHEMLSPSKSMSSERSLPEPECETPRPQEFAMHRFEAITPDKSEKPAVIVTGKGPSLRRQDSVDKANDKLTISAEPVTIATLPSPPCASSDASLRAASFSLPTAVQSADESTDVYADSTLFQPADTATTLSFSVTALPSQLDACTDADADTVPEETIQHISQSIKPNFDDSVSFDLTASTLRGEAEEEPSPSCLLSSPAAKQEQTTAVDLQEDPDCAPLADLQASLPKKLDLTDRADELLIDTSLMLSTLRAPQMSGTLTALSSLASTPDQQPQQAALLEEEEEQLTLLPEKFNLEEREALTLLPEQLKPNRQSQLSWLPKDLPRPTPALAEKTPSPLNSQAPVPEEEPFMLHPEQTLQPAAVLEEEASSSAAPQDDSMTMLPGQLRRSADSLAPIGESELQVLAGAAASVEKRCREELAALRNRALEEVVAISGQVATNKTANQEDGQEQPMQPSCEASLHLVLRQRKCRDDVLSAAQGGEELSMFAEAEPLPGTMPSAASSSTELEKKSLSRDVAPKVSPAEASVRAKRLNAGRTLKKIQEINAAREARRASLKARQCKATEPQCCKMIKESLAQRKPELPHCFDQPMSSSPTGLSEEDQEEAEREEEEEQEEEQDENEEEKYGEEKDEQKEEEDEDEDEDESDEEEDQVKEQTMRQAKDLDKNQTFLHEALLEDDEEDEEEEDHVREQTVRQAKDVDKNRTFRHEALLEDDEEDEEEEDHMREQTMREAPDAYNNRTFRPRALSEDEEEDKDVDQMKEQTMQKAHDADNNQTFLPEAFLRNLHDRAVSENSTPRSRLYAVSESSTPRSISTDCSSADVAAGGRRRVQRPSGGGKTLGKIEEIKAAREARRAALEAKRRGRQRLLEEGTDPDTVRLVEMLEEWRERHVAPTKEPHLLPVALDRKLVVCVRKRPLNEKERSTGAATDFVTLQPGGRVVMHEPGRRVDRSLVLQHWPFKFDLAFDETTSNEEVFASTAQSLVDAAVQDEASSTMLAYGQTGSGKTFSMAGAAGIRALQAGGNHEAGMLGMYQLSALYLFERLDELRRPVLVTVSFIEIHGPKVRDLLDNRREVRLLEDGHGHTKILGAREAGAASAAELCSHIVRGSQLRVSKRMAQNNESSRSHAVLCVQLYAPGEGGKKSTLGRPCGRFSLVDLAGNERGADNQAASAGARLESGEINKSLLALKECIRSLARGRPDDHTPFRQSKLTTLLRESFLNPRARVCLLSCVSPRSTTSEYTLNTLRYASMLKQV